MEIDIMIKILIVDDEMLVRNGLKKIITKHSEEYEVCGCACDGEEAVRLITEASPDIVVTDIKMPNMDGIELIKWIRKNQSAIECILLSGYDEKEYLHEAIRQHVSEYILKPIVKEKFYTTLDRIAEEVKEKKKLAGQRAFNVSINNRFGNGVYKIITASTQYEKTEIEEIIKQQCPSFDIDGSMYVILISNTTVNDTQTYGGGETHIVCYGIKNIIDEMLDEMSVNAYGVLDANHNIIILVQKSDRCIVDIMSEIREKIRDSIMQDISIAISDEYTGVENSEGAYEKTEKLIKSSIMGSGIFTSGTKSNFEMQTLFRTNKKIVSMIERANIGCMKLIDEMFEKYETGVYPPESIIIMTEDFILRLKIFAKDKKYISSEEIGKYTKRIENNKNAEQLKENMKRLAEYVLSQISQQVSDGISKKIFEVQKYVNENYYKDITLNKISELFSINENYFSGQFKKQIGISFIDYLTEVRINKAKELLAENDISIGEISEMIGYENATYFSKVFKKVTGISPIQYKMKLVGRS